MGVLVLVGSGGLVGTAVLVVGELTGGGSVLAVGAALPPSPASGLNAAGMLGAGVNELVELEELVGCPNVGSMVTTLGRVLCVMLRGVALALGPSELPPPAPPPEPPPKVVPAVSVG